MIVSQLNPLASIIAWMVAPNRLFGVVDCQTPTIAMTIAAAIAIRIRLPRMISNLAFH